MSFAKPEKVESIADAITHKKVMRYACAANRCFMPGTISGEGGSGLCAYHYATNPGDWTRITQILLDWEIVTAEINACRTLLTDKTKATRPDLINAEFKRAWQRVKGGAGPWLDQLKPQPTREGGPMDSYGTWALRLERFIGQRVVESLRHQIGKQAA